MNTRTWKRAGYIAGIFTVLLTTTLVVLAYGASSLAGPRFTVLVMVNILAAFLTMALLVGAAIVAAFMDRESFGQQRWWNGYAAAIKDLKVDPKVVSIPTSRNGHH